LTRFVDRGAIVAGWIGAGMAMVIVIAFGLIIAIQPLVLFATIPLGVAIGAYANGRARRHWPRIRILNNALWAGAVTGVALAGLYLAVRLLFLYADSGLTLDGRQLPCSTGPECVYQRELDQGRAVELAQVGVTDAVSYERYRLDQMAFLGIVLTGFTVGGAALGGATQAMTGWARRERQEDDDAA
jgi:hypothetical protein